MNIAFYPILARRTSVLSLLLKGGIGLAYQSALIIGLLLVFCARAHAGGQVEEKLAASVQALLHRAVSDDGAPKLVFDSEAEAQAWLAEMSARLEKKIPDAETRVNFLKTMHYEAKRAGLDPQLVLGLIQVESNFRKYAVSSAGAMGAMQVMPFWVRLIGNQEHSLFQLRTNLRYGCAILRFYLDQEKGDLYRALGRYNGSLGKPDYPYAVLSNWQHNWSYRPPARAGTARVAAAPTQ